MQNQTFIGPLPNNVSIECNQSYNNNENTNLQNMSTNDSIFNTDRGTTYSQEHNEHDHLNIVTSDIEDDIEYLNTDMNTHEHDNPVDADILEFEQRIISSMYEAEGVDCGDTNAHEEYEIECSDVNNLTVNCDKVLLNKYLKEGQNTHNHDNYTKSDDECEFDDQVEDVNDEEDGIISFHKAKYQHVMDETDLNNNRAHLRNVVNQFIDKDNHNHNKREINNININQKPQKQISNKLIKNTPDSQSTSTLFKLDENNTSIETKIIHYTRFDSVPENNSQKIFVNLYHCRYDIINDVCSGPPFYFKVSKIEPYGEKTETDENGDKIYTKFDNVEFNNYDVIWFDSYFTPEKFSKIKQYQKMNHFPGMYLLTRKNYLAKSLKKIRNKFEEYYNFFPLTWLLPYEINNLRSHINDLQKNNKRKWFIIKPEAECQGKGIKLINHYNEIDMTEDNKWVCQQYLSKPMLIDGLKFDIRFYVLVTSVEPLRVWIHKDGFLRLATHKYDEPTMKNMDNLTMHLTNYAINKTSKNFKHNNTDDIMSGQGSKRHIEWFYKYVKESYGEHESNTLNLEIEKIVVKTLLSVQPSLYHYYKSCQPNDLNGNMCFEILGFDIMIDSKLKPWLIEVNHAPSFNTDSKLDKEVKQNMLTDTFSMLYLVGPKAKSLYRKNKTYEMEQKRLTNNFREAKEEKLRQAAEHIKKKDKYMYRNRGGYKLIYPTQDEDTNEEYSTIVEYVKEEWGNQTSVRKIDIEKKKAEFNANHNNKNKNIIENKKETIISPTEEKQASKEEINSIVNRLYYNRLSSKNTKTLQDVFNKEYENERNPINESHTSVVDINFEGNEQIGNHSFNSISNNYVRYGSQMGAYGYQNQNINYNTNEPIQCHGHIDLNNFNHNKKPTLFHITTNSFNSGGNNIGKGLYHNNAQSLNQNNNFIPNSQTQNHNTWINVAVNSSYSSSNHKDTRNIHSVDRSDRGDSGANIYNNNKSHGDLKNNQHMNNMHLDKSNNMFNKTTKTSNHLNFVNSNSFMRETNTNLIINNSTSFQNNLSAKPTSVPQKDIPKPNKHLQGRITSLSMKGSVDRNNQDMINPNINNLYIKKTRTFSKDRGEGDRGEGNHVNVEKDNNNINIRERSNDNFALYMQKLMSENKEIKDPTNVIQAKNINRTKKISYDKNDRPPRNNVQNNSLNINSLSINTKTEPSDNMLGLCVNGRGAIAKSNAHPKNKVGSVKNSNGVFNYNF